MTSVSKSTSQQILLSAAMLHSRGISAIGVESEEDSSPVEEECSDHENIS